MYVYMYVKCQGNKQKDVSKLYQGFIMSTQVHEYYWLKQQFSNKLDMLFNNFVFTSAQLILTVVKFGKSHLLLVISKAQKTGDLIKPLQSCGKLKLSNPDHSVTYEHNDFSCKRYSTLFLISCRSRQASNTSLVSETPRNKESLQEKSQIW